MATLCGICSRSIKPLSYAEAMQDDCEEVDFDEDCVIFQSDDVNGGSVRSTTLPQPNGDLCTPLSLEVDEVSYTTLTFVYALNFI